VDSESSQVRSVPKSSGAPRGMKKTGRTRSLRALREPQIEENIGERMRREQDSLVRTRLLTVAIFGAMLSPLFGIVDVLTWLSWDPSLPLPAVLVLRFGMTLWFAALWVFLRQTDRVRVTTMDWLIFAPPAVALGYLAGATGGASSPYVAGTTVLVVARTILVPGAARNHLPVVSFLVASYPLSVLAFGPHRGNLVAMLQDTAAMGYLAANLFPLVAIAGLGLVASDMIHAMHQRLVSARSLGKYKIRKELGRGAMGVVYLAWHRDLGRPCVIKVVAPDKDESGALRKRFEREARETSMLASPFTVRVFDFGITQEGQLFYVMEYLDGESLQERLDEAGPQDPALVARWACWACQSLAEAHARLLVHRDIKPANLFLARTADGREIVKVLDFGIARKADDKKRRRRRALDSANLPADPQLTAVGTIMGTPLYVAPEVLEGVDATEAADQYSLAASAYHLLTGRPVFGGATIEELLVNTLDQDAYAPSVVRRDVTIDPGLDEVLLRALAKNPHNRFESMEAFRQALEPFAADAASATSQIAALPEEL
jgi:tRNA A-37 threonylcarbamoyl transferase component Bud32